MSESIITQFQTNDLPTEVDIRELPNHFLMLWSNFVFCVMKGSVSLINVSGGELIDTSHDSFFTQISTQINANIWGFTGGIVTVHSHTFPIRDASNAYYARLDICNGGVTMVESKNGEITYVANGSEFQGQDADDISFRLNYLPTVELYTYYNPDAFDISFDYEWIVCGIRPD